MHNCTLVCQYSKVVRRVSVNERSSLYRREHHKEAMVWQERGRQPEPQDDDEDRQTDNELNQHATMVSKPSVVKKSVRHYCLFAQFQKVKDDLDVCLMLLFCFRLL